MGELIELPGVAGRPRWRLASIRQASGMSSERFATALAEEMGWPEMPAAVISALETGRPEPTPRLIAAAQRVLARTGRVQPRTDRPSAPISLVTKMLDITDAADGLAALDFERMVWPVADAGQLDNFQTFLHLCARQRRTMSLEVLVPATEASYWRLREVALDAPRATWRRAKVVAAEAALLTGRLYYFAGRRSDAYAALTFADAVAAEVGADGVRAAAEVAMSYLHMTWPLVGTAGDLAITMRLLNSAAALSHADASPLVRAWIFARRAEEHAATGMEVAAFNDIDTAATALSRVAEDALVSGPRSPEDLDGFRGAVLIHLQRPEAADVLERSLERLPSDLVPRRAHSLTDLAVARAQQGEVEAACAALSEAVSSAMRIGRIAYVARAVAVRRRHLTRWNGQPALNLLDDHLRSVAAHRPGN